jgi:hypothetical protein
MSSPYQPGDVVYGYPPPPVIAPYNDPDQGGAERHGLRWFLGPSIGWVDLPRSTLRVSTSTTLQLGYGIIAVGAAPITLTLPSFKGVPNATTTQAALAGRHVPVQITIIDSGGHASSANPITIVAASGETVSGLASVQISGPFGAIVLWPDPVNGGCSVVS